MSQADPPTVEVSRTRRRRVLRLAGAAVFVIMLVAAAVWIPRFHDAPPPSKQTALDTRPAAPQSAWVWRGGDLDVTSPEFGAARYGAPGAIIAGDQVIIRTTPDPTLVSLSLSDGRQRWSAPISPADGCARALLDGTLPCIKSEPDGAKHEVQFLDVNTGATTATARVPFNLAMLATDGKHLYTSGYNDQGGLTVARGSRDNPVAHWSTVVPQGQCAGYGGGDAMDLQVEQGLVWGFLGGGAEAVLRVSDGAPVFDHPVTSVSVLPGPTVSAVRCQSGVDAANALTEVVDAHGRALFTTGSLQTHALEDVQQLPAFVTTGGDVLDPATGQKTAHIAPPAGNSELPNPTWLIDNTVVMPDGGLAAFDVRTGAQLWRNPTASAGSDAVSDGHYLLLTNDRGGVDAISLADGSLGWSTGTAAGSGPSAIYVTDGGLVVVTHDSVELLR